MKKKVRIRINPRFGKALPVPPKINPTAKANNRKTSAQQGNTWKNKARIESARLNDAFKGGRPFPKANSKGQGGAAMGAFSRRAYLSQTALRYPRAAALA